MLPRITLIQQLHIIITYVGCHSSSSSIDLIAYKQLSFKSSVCHIFIAYMHKKATKEKTFNYQRHFNVKELNPFIKCRSSAGAPGAPPSPCPVWNF